MSIKIGQKIYVPTNLFLSHGRDDFIGGLAEVIAIEDGVSAGKPAPFVIVKESPNCRYNWKFLKKQQKELKKQFGKNQAHADPDYSLEFNEW